MKAVLISIRPEWCEKIASGEKTVEIRKTRPKLEPPFKVYIYCTIDKRLLRKFDKGERIDDEHFFDEHVFVRQNTWIRGHFNPNKKVIGEFVCCRIDKIGKRGFHHNFDYCYQSLNQFGNDDIEIEITDIQKSCISKKELNLYGESSPSLLAWHISDLKIYDHPKKLSEFAKPDKCPYNIKGECTYTRHCYRAGQTKRCGGYLERPPQSWCYVEEVTP